MNIKKENLYTQNCIRTFSGEYVDVLNPNPDFINITDISRSLSKQCRFGGHTQLFYSVAQHCLECSYLVKPEHQLAALLHDASEAYLMDIPSPIKHRLTNYKKIEDNLMRTIALKFGFTYPLSDQVKNIDKEMLEQEWSNIVIKFNPEWRSIHSPVIACTLFEERFKELMKWKKS